MWLRKSLEARRPLDSRCRLLHGASLEVVDLAGVVAVEEALADPAADGAWCGAEALGAVGLAHQNHIVHPSTSRSDSSSLAVSIRSRAEVAP